MHMSALAAHQAQMSAETLMLEFIGSTLRCEPDEQIVGLLLTPGIFDETPLGSSQPPMAEGLSLLRSWAMETRKHDARNVLTDLRRDYFNLFEGPGHPKAPIWESVYFNDKGMVFQEQTLDVRRSYATHNLQVTCKNTEPDDNLGLELLFAAHLTQKALDALEAGNEVTASKLVDERNDFLEEHPLCWAYVWGSLVDTHADQKPVYRGLSLLVRATLEIIASTWGLTARRQPLVAGAVSIA